MSDAFTDIARQTERTLEHVRKQAEKEISSEQPKEYIITDKMIKAWRNECVKGIQIKFDDSRCLGCEFCGTGARYHCCDFDDVDVEQMFRSRPHPAPAAIPKRMNAFVVTAKELEQVEESCINEYGDWMGVASDILFEKIRSRHIDNLLKDFSNLDDWLKEHDTAIARKAREDVLNEVREKLSHIRYQDEDMWFIEATIKVIESLRSREVQE